MCFTAHGVLKRVPILWLLLAGLVTTLLLLFSALIPLTEAKVFPPGSQLKTAVTGPEGTNKSDLIKEYGRLPLSFEANRENNNGVRFIARGHGFSLYLMRNGAAVVLAAKTAADKSGESFTHHVLRMRLAGANSNPLISGLDQLPGKANYFIGSDPHKWRTGVPLYSSVRYRRVYPGVDAVYHGNHGQLEYDFVIAPRQSVRRIQIEFEGADNIFVDSTGDLVITVGGISIRQQKPVAYQDVAGERREIGVRYKLHGHKVGFQVDGYDHSEPLIIDPVLIYSSFLGGSSTEQGLGVAIDSQGAAYITGSTTSTDFPLAASYQSVKGAVDDAFVVKLNAAGNALVYSTYIGGNGSDNGNTIAVDSQGNAYIAGLTGSGSFPTTSGAFQTSKSGFADGFVTKLNASGSALLYSTYIGGDNNENIFGIAVDASQRAYVTGRTDSTQLNFFPLQRHGTPVYKSSNAATLWAASATDLTASLVNAFAIDPGNSNIIYVGTNVGVFQSLDAGGHWSLTGLTRPSTAPITTNVVGVDPTNSSTIYGGSTNGVYKSTNSGGLYDQKNTGLTSLTINALAIDPVTPATLYVGTNLGIFKSTNGADSWVEVKNGITGTSPRVNEIVFDPTNSSAIYIGTSRGMFKTTNAGGLWTPINGGAFSNGAQITALVIDPITPSTLYAAARVNNEVFFKSTDSGATWTGGAAGLTYSGGGLTFAPTINTMAINPVTPSTLYAASTGGGVYKSADSGANWTQVNNGIANATAASVAVDRINPSVVYAGTNIGTDAFIARLNTAGSTLDYLVGFGGDEADEARGVAVDGNSNAYIVGTTSSANFPTQTAFQPGYGGFADAFVTKINADGSSFVYSTFLGGNNTEQGFGIAVRNDRAYVVGQVQSQNFPLTNPIKSSIADFDIDAFVSEFNVTGSALDFSTYLGGEDIDQGVAVAVDNGGNIYVTGSTFSLLFPVQNAPQPNPMGSTEAFVTKLDPSSASIVYSTYLGGSSGDVGNSIAVDSSGNAYVVGNTSSSNFPSINPFQSTLKASDAFITKIGITADLSVSKADSRDPVLVNSGFGYTLTVTNSGPSAATGIMVVDTLPSSITLNSATLTQGTCSLNGSMLTCNLGAMASAATATITLSVTPTTTGMITNTVTVTGNEPDANTANNTASETTKISASPSIRGYVKDTNNIGVGGVLMTLTGTQAGTVQTDSTGFYQFAELPTNGNYTLTPSKTNLSIDPESMTFNPLSADQTAEFIASTCTYSLVPLTQSFGASGGNGLVNVVSLHSCPWTAARSDGWLNITSGTSGVGSGTVNFSVSPTTVPRAAYLTIAGLNFAVYQEFNSCAAPAFDVATYNLFGSPTVIRSADLDADGDIDLVLGTGGGTSGGGIPAMVMLNNGLGVFSSASFDTGLGVPQGFVLADFNSDGKPDIAMTSYNLSVVRIFFNNGSGGFGQTNVDIPFTSQGQSPLTRAPFKADVNKDGKADLLISTPGTNGLQVLIGNGSGGFTQASPIALGASFSLIEVADINNDANEDLVLGGAGSAAPMGIMLGNGSGAFGAAIISTGINAISFATIGDFDGDGKVDIFTGSAVMSGDGTGHFVRKSTLTAQPMGGLTSGDFNRDGKTDVAFTWGSTQVAVFFGDGIGGLGGPIDTNTGGNSQFPGNSGIVAADFNADGKLDLAAANYTIGAKVLLNSCPSASTNVFISDVNVIEGNSGTANVIFNVNLSAPSAQIVGVSYETIEGTAFAGAGNDYFAASGSVTFNPGETEKTVTVAANGDTTVEPNETFFVNLFNSTNVAISKSLGTATIINDDGQVPVQLIMEDSASPANHLAALDTLLLTRDPFHVLNVAHWFQLGSDQNTRVSIFAKNLQLNQGETAAAVEINVSSGNFTAAVSAQDVRSLPNSDLTQVTFRLPNNLPPGICVVSIKVHGQSSNSGVFRVVQ